MGQAMKSGIGTASLDIGNGVVVGAIAVVNSLGDIIDPATGKIIAGARSIHQGPIQIGSSATFANTLEVMKSFIGRTTLGIASHEHTTIGVVATNARLDKEQVNKVAQMAQDGLARTVRPAHTMFDGDTIFALATGKRKADVNIIGAFAAEVFAQAILRAVRTAKGAVEIPAISDLAV
jgi:L-aminopeptidase/D-esterase-like protein